MNRVPALLLAFILALFSTQPLVQAASAEAFGCTHTEHDEFCGYEKGAPCLHEHDALLCGWDEDTQSGCTHDCADGTCSYIEAQPCGHQHDTNCGGLTLGDSGEAVIIAGFDPLADAIARQNFSVGEATLADVNLPDTLTVTDAACGARDE